MARLRILHLVGSPTCPIYGELSVLYAAGCLHALDDPAQYEFVIALVTPDGSWRFPVSLERAAVDAAPAMGMAAALARLVQAGIDVAVPHLFCLAGMTHYRAVLGVLKIPYLGNRPLQMALAADKAMARHLVAAAGVRVPAAELLRRGDSLPPLSLSLPVVVKPNDADNSDGLTLVHSSDAYPAAVALALSFSEQVLVESFIPLGREVRCGIVVEAGRLRLLPLEEYWLDANARPVRTRTDKLKRDDQQGLVLVAKEASQAWIVPMDDPIVPAVWEAARLCHTALGCEQYSLFDFRLDPQGRVWFLEAGLYCSFSPKSVLVSMVAAAGTPLSVFFRTAIDNALQVRPVP
jgi:D-alanine-D-alanine ligase